jgi:hypothetical protein
MMARAQYLDSEQNHVITLEPRPLPMPRMEPDPQTNVPPSVDLHVSGADIKELRKRMGRLTQMEFANVVGLTREHVAKLETEAYPIVGMTRILFLWLMSVYGLNGQPPHPSIPLVIVPQTPRT